MKVKFLLILLTITCAYSSAEELTNTEVFARTDPSGNVTYTNILPADASIKKATPDTSHHDITKTKPAMPKLIIPIEVQSIRDQKRRSILLSELEQEQRALILTQSKSDQVETDSHNRNILLLKRELGFIK